MKNINKNGWKVIRIKDKDVNKYNKVDLLNYVLFLVKNNY